MTSRPIRQDEELCIFYGHKLWFQNTDAPPIVDEVADPDDGWAGLSGLGGDEQHNSPTLEWSLLEGRPDDVVHVDDLPFTRIKLTPDDEEEDEPDAVRTGKAFSPFLPLLRA